MKPLSYHSSNSSPIALKTIRLLVRSLVKTIYCYENRSKRKGKIDFEKYFLKLTNHAVYEKTKENGGKDRDIKLVTTAIGRNQPSYQTKKCFCENLLAVEMIKNRDTYE